MKAFDPSKFVKGVTKAIKGMSLGFHDPDTWVSTGNYALNYRISGNFEWGIPLGKVAVFAGETGAGKSYIVSGNIIREAQKQGIYVFVVDSENALDEKWLNDLGVETTPDKLTKFNMAMIDDVAKTLSDFVKGYRDDYGALPREERPKVLWVVDSLGMLMSPTEVNQFDCGDMKGDMGRKAKQLKSLVTNCVNMFGDLNIGLVATNHTYASQDMFDPDPKVSGGSGFAYASSMMIAMKKLKLKEDENGEKTSSVNGIRAVCKIMKTRYNKPFETVEVKIPYDTGMNPYSGLFDMFEAMDLVTKVGNKMQYIDIDTGEVISYFRKGWESNANGCLDLIMSQFKRNPLVMPPTEVSDEFSDGGITDEFLDSVEE